MHDEDRGQGTRSGHNAEAPSRTRVPHDQRRTSYAALSLLFPQLHNHNGVARLPRAPSFVWLTATRQCDPHALTRRHSLAFGPYVATVL